MSWPVAAYGLLALALLVGFLWWERTRPDAKVIALVGALAALATLGRMAFAAVPNVKPSTDIVIIAGLALGGAPGFTVGAVTALASNFFFGQGPWTPWQMLGWGLCGVIGALLGARGNAIFTKRIPLAVACFVLGFAFTAFQDFGDWVTYSGAHTLGQLGAYIGSGVGFDVISAGSSAAFAVIFGPALIRSLKRFRMRLNVQWVSAALLPGLVLGLLTAAPHPATAATDQTPIQYLENAPLSSPLYSGWAALGLEADGIRPPARLIDYITASQGSDPGSIERSILALAPIGRPVASLVRRLHFTPSIDDQTNLTAFGVLALRAAGRPVPAATISWLRHQEDADGGFNFATAGSSSDVDDTGAVLEALGDVPRAVHFIEENENSDGGYPSEPGQSSNAQSTAFAIQGLIAAGQRPVRAIAYLRTLIRPDGSIDYARGNHQTPEWVTGEAVMAISAQALPLAPVAARPAATTSTPAPTAPATSPTRGFPPLNPALRAVAGWAAGVIRAINAF